MEDLSRFIDDHSPLIALLLCLALLFGIIACILLYNIVAGIVNSGCF